jgi:hypothetical protein
MHKTKSHREMTHKSADRKKSTNAINAYTNQYRFSKMENE